MNEVRAGLCAAGAGGRTMPWQDDVLNADHQNCIPTPRAPSSRSAAESPFCRACR